MQHYALHRLGRVSLISMQLQLFAVPSASIARTRDDQLHGLLERHGADSRAAPPRTITSGLSLVVPRLRLPAGSALRIMPSSAEQPHPLDTLPKHHLSSQPWAACPQEKGR
jgi:hypothetical protein